MITIFTIKVLAILIYFWEYFVAKIDKINLKSYFYIHIHLLAYINKQNKLAKMAKSSNLI